jgi:hypothetical protein
MKKVIFAVSVVTLALLVVTCDLFPPPTGSLGTVQTAAAEPGWTTLSIDIADSNGRARAINQTQDSGSVDFYEVVFIYNDGQPGSITVRGTHAATNTTGWSLTVPKVNYNASNNKAVLFAGKSGTTNVLIAIGNVTGGGNLLGSDTSITFTLTGITSGVGTTTYAASSFSVGTINTGALVMETADSVSAPVFKISGSATVVTATYNFNIPKSGAVVAGAGTVTRGTVTGPAVTTTITAASITSPTSGAIVTPGNFTVNLNLTPGTVSGFAKIFIAVPVYALNSTASPGGTYNSNTAETWYLQGGVNNANLDTGANTGGAILLEVVVSAPPPPPTISVASNGPANANGWDATSRVLTHVKGGGGATGTFTLTATTTNTASITWKTSISGTPAGGDPAAAGSGGTFENATTGGSAGSFTLTIPYDDIDAKAITSKFYVYAVADNGSTTDLSPHIEINVIGPVGGSVDINE